MAFTRACAAAAIALLCSACAHRAPPAATVALRVADPAAPAFESEIPEPWPSSAVIVQPARSAVVSPPSTPSPVPSPQLAAPPALPPDAALRLWLVATPRPRERLAFPATQPFVALPILEPTAQPAPAQIPYLPANALPRIVGVSLPSGSVSGGETVDGEVRTSSNVASVEVRVANYGASMEKVAPGDFTLAVTVPHLPFFLRNRTYTIHVIARNTRGDSVTQNVGVIVR